MRGGAALPETEQRASGHRKGAENRRCRVVVEPGDGVGVDQGELRCGLACTEAAARIQSGGGGE
jgi:hypothetical protein